MVRDQYLIQRGKQWYLRLAIPRSIRPLFPSGTGKPRDFIAEPLGGLGYEAARTECARRVADYRALFARASLMTPDAVRAEIDAIKQRAAGRQSVADLPMLQSELERIRRDAAAEPELFIPDELARATWRAGINPRDPQTRDLWIEIAQKVRAATEAGQRERFGVPAPQDAETVNQAAEAWLAEMQRDPTAAPKATTLDGHRLRVRAFVEHCGDVPLASITRAMASDFLAKVAAGRSNRTTNNYATTMASVFKSARLRGRFQGDSPFEGMKRKAGGESYEAFSNAEVQALLAALPRDIAPTKHSPETALPWAALIGAYTGMRLEEIAQLTVADIQTRGSNGGTVVVIDVHNGGKNHLKNESSARAVPIHSELARGGLLDYARSLPQDGPLFPGLTRRASKGGKIGARLGELFRKRLAALGMKRERLCFHSFRHSVAERLEAAAVSQTDAARVLGHTVAGMSYGVYSTGPGLKRLAAVVEAIRYDDR